MWNPERVLGGGKHGSGNRMYRAGGHRLHHQGEGRKAPQEKCIPGGKYQPEHRWGRSQRVSDSVAAWSSSEAGLRRGQRRGR